MKIILFSLLLTFSNSSFATCGSHFDDIDFALEALDNLIYNGGVGYGLYDATNDIDPCSTSGIRIYIVDPFGGFLNVGNNDGGIG